MRKLTRMNTRSQKKISFNSSSHVAGKRWLSQCVLVRSLYPCSLGNLASASIKCLNSNPIHKSLRSLNQSSCLLCPMFFCWLVMLVDVDVLILAGPFCIVRLEPVVNFVDSGEMGLWHATPGQSFGLKPWSLENMKIALLWPSYHLKFCWNFL